MKHILFYLFLFSTLFVSAQNKDSLLQVANGNGPDTARIKAFVRLSEVTRRQNGALALTYVNNALALSDSTGRNSYFFARASFEKGVVLISNGDFDSAQIFLEPALRIFKKLNNDFYTAATCNSLGTLNAQQGNYTKALTYYFEALTIASKTNDQKKQAAVLGNIGNCYTNMDDAQNAIKYFNQSVEIRRRLDDKRGLITSLTNLGDLYLDVENDKDAEIAFNEVAKLMAEVGDSNDSLYYFVAIGKLYDNKKEYDKALDCFFKAKKLGETIGDEPATATSTLLIGLMYLSRKDTVKANLFLDEGIAKLRKMGELPIIEDTYESIADRYAKIGMPMKAYELLKKMLVLQDTLHSNELSELIAKKESQFKNEKRQHELDVYKKNSEISELSIARQRYLIAFLAVAVFLILLGIGFLFNRNRAKQNINEQLETQNAEISLQKKSITDSIDYAKKIQDSILPPEKQIKRVLADGFILYEPKDVVSGDFYWLDSRDGLSIFAAVDCTGHGVPGALMSVIGFNLLNQAVNEMGITKPSDILHHLDFGVNKLLRQSDSGSTVKDGMDLGLCTYDPATRKLQFAGVFNPAYIITKGELKQINADKFPIGINVDGVTDNYTNNEVQMYSGDMIYLFSDGYADQFGGPAGKKFKYKRFRELLLEIQSRPVEEQKNELRKAVVEWKGNLEQVDDILVIGMRVI